MINYKGICSRVSALARETGESVKSYAATHAIEVQTKGPHDFVTQMDKYSEKLLVDGLSELLPEAGFITEEGTRQDKGETYNWIIDPIDGTTNFIHNVPPHAISIGLQEGDEIVVGVIYELCACELYSAYKGGGAWLNGKQIHTSQVTALDKALVATGFPFRDQSQLEQYINAFRKLCASCAGLRRHGSAAIDMAYLAAGRFDAFFEYGLKPWDVAAGMIIVREAGGVCADFSGGGNCLLGEEMVATNGALQEPLGKVMKECFK